MHHQLTSQVYVLWRNFQAGARVNGGAVPAVNLCHMYAILERDSERADG